MEVKPNTIAFTTVCDTWSKSGKTEAVERIERLISIMKELSAEGYKDVYPNEYTYNCLFTAIARSKDDDKAVKALQVLRDMQQDRKIKANNFTYNAMLSACAYSTQGSSKDRVTAIKIAIIMVEEAIEKARKGDKLNITYGTFFTACSNLTVNEDERIKIEKVVEALFLQCCAHGQVDGILIKQLRGATSKRLFHKLLGKYKPFTSTDVPNEWHMNVKRGHPGSNDKVEPKDQGPREALLTSIYLDEDGRKFRKRGKR